MRVPYAKAVFGKEELKAVQEVFRDPAQAAGRRMTEFGKRIAKVFGKKYGVMVNSGSSANFLALKVLGSPGTEVITPVVTFSTTVAPIIQLGMKPKFFDVGIGTYQIDVDAVEAYLKKAPKKKRILMIPALIGNIPDLSRLRKLSRAYGMPFVLDSCDTLGATWRGKPIGSYADIVTSSFFGSHVITAGGGGGIVVVDDKKLAEKVTILRSWGRASALFGESENIAKRFNATIDGIPYDAKFIFDEVGYNMQATEIQAAFGLAQLKKLERFSSKRKRNFKTLYSYFVRTGRFFMPIQPKEADTNWLSFPLTIADSAPFRRKELALFLERNGIQTRPLFTGNILRQPAFNKLFPNLRPTSFPNAEVITRRSIIIGCHQELTQEQLSYLIRTFATFLAKHSRKKVKSA